MLKIRQFFNVTYQEKRGIFFRERRIHVFSIKLNCIIERTYHLHIQLKSSAESSRSRPALSSDPVLIYTYLFWDLWILIHIWESVRGAGALFVGAPRRSIVSIIFVPLISSHIDVQQLDFLIVNLDTTIFYEYLTVKQGCQYGVDSSRIFV